jgi:hypothetical protein
MAILVMIPGLRTLRRARCVGTGRAKRLIFLGRCTAGRKAALHRLGPPPLPEECVFEEFEGLMKQGLAAALQGSRLSKLALIECFTLGLAEIIEPCLLLQDQAMLPKDSKKELASYLRESHQFGGS